jgi:prepilin-type N-terminal cleavage/methylation domain-containing protein
MMRRAFTLVEMLVVIVISAILLGIAVPAFQALLSSSRQSMAQNSLQQAIFSARDMAARNIGGGDAAAVFFYDRDRGLSVGVYEQVASFSDWSVQADHQKSVDRDLFVPVSSMEAVRLPDGYMVRGFALGTRLRDGDWYDGLVDFSPQSGNLQGSGSDRGPGAWVFPETDFYDQTEQDDGDDRQTFMIRFTAGSGALSRDPTAAVVIDARPSSENRMPIGDIEPINTAEDLRSWAVRAATSESIAIADRWLLLGNESSDTVLAQPVTDLAMYRERRLAQMLRLRGLNKKTKTIYERDDEPSIDSALFRDTALASDRVELETQITKWIEGRLAIDSDAPAGSADEADSAVYTISAYYGDLIEVKR